MVNDALATAQDFLQDRLRLSSKKRVFMVRGGQAEYPASNSDIRANSQSRPKAKFKPDWAGVGRLQHPAFKARNILPGDTKVGGKWTSGDIVRSPVVGTYMASDWIKPLKQIYTYCLKSGSR